MPVILSIQNRPASQFVHRVSFRFFPLPIRWRAQRREKFKSAQPKPNTIPTASPSQRPTGQDVEFDIVSDRGKVRAANVPGPDLPTSPRSLRS